MSIILYYVCGVFCLFDTIVEVLQDNSGDVLVGTHAQMCLDLTVIPRTFGQTCLLVIYKTHGIPLVSFYKMQGISRDSKNLVNVTLSM